MPPLPKLSTPPAEAPLFLTRGHRRFLFLNEKENMESNQIELMCVFVPHARAIAVYDGAPFYLRPPPLYWIRDLDFADNDWEPEMIYVRDC